MIMIRAETLLTWSQEGVEGQGDKRRHGVEYHSFFSIMNVSIWLISKKSLWPDITAQIKSHQYSLVLWVFVSSQICHEVLRLTLQAIIYHINFYESSG